MITESSIPIIVEAFVIEMTFEIAVLALKCKEAFDRFDIGEVLIGRGNDTAFCASFNSCFDILEQKDKASLFDEADRKGECLTAAEVVLYFFR